MLNHFYAVFIHINGIIYPGSIVVLFAVLYSLDPFLWYRETWYTWNQVTSNYSTNNNVVLFFVSDLKTITLDQNALDKRGQSNLRHNLFGDKII